MSNVHGNPDDIENFANSLSFFVEGLRELSAGLDAAFSRLGETWCDDKRMRFEEDYNELRQQLFHFGDCAEEHIPHLLTMAARMRDYLNS